VPLSRIAAEPFPTPLPLRPRLKNGDISGR